MNKKFLFVTSLCMMLFFAVIPTNASEIDSANTETAENQILSSSMSSETDASVSTVSPKLKAAVLSAPDLTATNLSSSIKISWNKVSNADGYYIYRRTADGSWSTKAYKTITKASTTSFEDTNYKSGTGYYYRAVAYMKANEKTVKSEYSEECYIKRMSRPSLSKYVGNGFITINWDNISGSSGYIVYRNGEKVAVVNESHYHDTSVKEGKTYSYTVKAYYQKSGKSYYSASSKSLSVKSASFTGASPVCELENTATSIHISWSPVPNKTVGYYIYEKEGDGDWNPIPIVRISGTYKQQYYDKSFKKGTLYSYQIRPYKIVNGQRIIGNASKTKTIMRLSRPSSSVSNAANGVKVSWGAIAGAQKYSIYRDGKSIGTSDDTSYIDTNIINGKKYEYKVRAIYTVSPNNNCFSEFSAPDTIYRLKNMIVTELKAGPERFKVTFKKNSSATGYEIVYSRNSDFSNAKTVKTTSTYKTVKYLEAEETYYVKVRSYEKVGSKYYYSNYSDVQTVLTE